MLLDGQEMIEGSINKKEVNRERYVSRRKLVCSIHEFDSGDMSKAKPKGMFEGTGRFENRTEAKIVMKMTCSGCPVQYEGKINGKAAYYRSRGGIWTFEIYEGKFFYSPIIFQKEGIDKTDAIGWEGMLAAEKIIMENAIKWVNNVEI